MNTGIYEIVNTVNGKRYVGSAKDFKKRWGGHRAQLKKGRHHNRHLQSSWNKHGAAAFAFRKLLVCSPENLLMYEQIAIDATAPEFNVEKVAGSSIGCIRTPETRAKIAAKAIGRVWTEESKAKLSANTKGRKLTEERRQKLIGNKHAAGQKHTPERKAAISAFMTGLSRPKSQEHREKIAATLRGRKATPEHRANQSAAQKGKARGSYRPWSDEAKARFKEVMREQVNPMKGRTHTQEARALMSAKQKDRPPPSVEQKARIGAAAKAMWADPIRRQQILDARANARVEREKGHK